MYISCVNTCSKSPPFYCCVFTAKHVHCCCLRHPIQMVAIETIWELHTLIVMNSCRHPPSFPGPRPASHQGPGNEAIPQPCHFSGQGETVWLNRLFNQTPWLLFFSLLVIVRLLFKGSVYFVLIVQLLCKGGDYARAASLQKNTVVL